MTTQMSYAKKQKQKKTNIRNKMKNELKLQIMIAKLHLEIR